MFLDLAERKSLFACVIVCGSIAKNDIVPGWSDIDIVCLPRDEVDASAAMNEVRGLLSQVRTAFELSIGIDLVYPRELLATSRLCGRPLSMTYEVAQYGQFYFCSDPFEGIQPLGASMEIIRRERLPLALAELHNWRRTYLGDSSSRESIYAGVRSALKILKVIVAPYLGVSFTHEEDFEHLSPSIDPGLIRAFRSAIDIRKNWPNDDGRNLFHSVETALLRLDATKVAKAITA
ncbi:hypothetical protein [Micromonospora chersina]|uniref:hypothetical protein n=1 Tax=Micromonospora chersina TaxID=47854 RepID=UPI003716866C